MTKLAKLKHLTVEQLLAGLVGNRNSQIMLADLLEKAPQIERDRKLIAGAPMSLVAYQNLAKQNSELASIALSKQWENVQTLLVLDTLPKLIKITNLLATGLDNLTGVMERHPVLIRRVTEAFVGLSAALLIGGTVTMAASSLRGLGLVLTSFGKATLMSDIGGLSAIGAATGALGKFGATLKWVGAVATAWEIGSWIGNMLRGAMDNQTAQVMGDPNATAGATAYDRIHPFNPKTGKREFSFSGLASTLLDPVPTASEAAVIKKNNQLAANYHRIWQNGGWLSPEQAMSYQAGAKQQPVQVNSTINLDGKQIAKVVTTHQANAATGPQTGTSSFDSSISPTPIGVTGGW